MTGLRFTANLHWLFTEVDFDDRFAAASAAGFRGVEFPDQWVGRTHEIAALLRECDLKQVLINTPAGAVGSPGSLGWASVPGAEDDFKRSFESALTAATTLASDFVHIRAGALAPGQSQQAALDLATERIAWAARQAEGTGVLPVLEMQNRGDMPGFAYRGIDDAVDIVHEVSSDRVQLLLDLYHLEIVDGSVLARLDELLPLTAHIQIADPPNRTEPGTGTLDWASVFAMLERTGYPGWIGCEYRPSTTTAATLGWAEPYGLNGRRPSRQPEESRNA